MHAYTGIYLYKYVAFVFVSVCVYVHAEFMRRNLYQ